jgi:spore coat protein CotH
VESLRTVCGLSIHRELTTNLQTIGTVGLLDRTDDTKEVPMFRAPLAGVVAAIALTAACSPTPGHADTTSDGSAGATPSSSGETVGSTSSTASTSVPTVEESAASPDEATLFDERVVHDIAVSYDQADYDAMIDAYVETGEKEWIEASVTIDGVVHQRVGLRLKGNSTLSGLGGGRFPGADQPPSGGLGPAGSATADEPESLPWLIRLDEFVEGQDHQGYEDIVIRSNRSATSLNEAVALDLLDEAGLASQRAASTTFTVNGGEPVLRLAIEHPDDDAWQERVFDGDGALYKAESTGDWSYRGDDPATTSRSGTKRAAVTSPT